MKSFAFIILAASAIITGCAGSNFTKIPDEQLAIGKTTEAEIRAKLGTPYQEGAREFR